MNSKNRKTFAAVFTRPKPASIVFSEIESLVKALSGEVIERHRSRVKITLLTEQRRCQRPHSGKEAKRYQVEEARELFERVGMKP